MEHRNDLERMLLAGLPEQDRKETVESICAETACGVPQCGRAL